MYRAFTLLIIAPIVAATGCAPKMEYVKRDMGIVDWNVEAETRSANPLIESVSTDGTHVVYCATREEERRKTYYNERLYREVYREKCGICSGLAFGLSGAYIGTWGIAIGEGARLQDGFLSPRSENVFTPIALGTAWIGIPAIIASGIRISELAKHPPKEYTITEFDREGAWEVVSTGVPVTGSWELVHELPSTGESYSINANFTEGVFNAEVTDLISEFWREKDWKIRLVAKNAGSLPSPSRIGPWVLTRVDGDTETALAATLHQEQVDALMRQREATRARIAREASDARRKERESDSCYQMGRSGGLEQLLYGYLCANERVGAALTILLPEEVKLELLKEEERVQAEYRAELATAFFGGNTGTAEEGTGSTPLSDSDQKRPSSAPPRRDGGDPPSSFCVGEVLYPDKSACRNCPVSGSTSDGVTERVYTDEQGRFFLPLTNNYLKKIYVDGIVNWSGNSNCYGGCRIDITR